MSIALRQIKSDIVAVVGFTLLFVGGALLILPGPSIIVIPLPLATLATQFV